MRTFPLIQGQRVVVVAVIILRGLWEVVGVPQLIEVRVLQGQLCSGPLVPIQNQHLLQQVDGCQGRRGVITSKLRLRDPKLMC